jgi:hypothetical protein
LPTLYSRAHRADDARAAALVLDLASVAFDEANQRRLWAVVELLSHELDRYALPRQFIEKNA